MTTSPDFLIRDARPSDVEFIAEFNRLLALETEGKAIDLEVLRQGVASALADPNRLRYWVAIDAATERPIGQSGATREWSDWRNGWIWWIQSVYVTSEARGRGVFRALHRTIREAAQAEPDVIGLRLYVENENHAAQKTYEALGMCSGGYHIYEEFWNGHPGGTPPA